MQDKLRVGWIGIGKMGSRMSMRLQKAGYSLLVNDIEKAQAADVIAAGASFVASAAKLAESVDVVFAIIPNSPVLLDILQGDVGVLKTIRPGTIFVDMSTIDPKGSAEAARLLEEKNCIFLRTPVSGSLEHAENGTLGIMCSGNKEAFEKVLPILKQIGNRFHYLGDGEEARYLKIGISMMVGNIAQMLAESLVFGEKMGLDWETMLDVYADSAAASPVIKYKLEALKKRDFSPMGTVGIVEKDLRFAMDIARDEMLALPLTALTYQYFNAMRASGRIDMDYASVLLLNEEINNLNK